MPNASCSPSCHPAPSPRMKRPPVALSRTVAAFATTAGCRNVFASTAIPIHLPGTLLASAAAVVRDSNAPPPRSTLASVRWSLIQPAEKTSRAPASAQIASRVCQSRPWEAMGAVRKPRSPGRVRAEDAEGAAMRPRLRSHRRSRKLRPMTFNVAADAYDRFMGRYSTLLSPQMADLAGVRAGRRVLDVGCGPGALTAELVARVGAAAVAAVDPSEPFVAAAMERFPGVDIRRAPAEDLPFDDDSFDASIAQLVVHFMADPVAGLREMRRVTRPGGTVAACVWDFAGGRGPLSVFWRAAHDLDPSVEDDAHAAG